MTSPRARKRLGVGATLLAVAAALPTLAGAPALAQQGAQTARAVDAMAAAQIAQAPLKAEAPLTSVGAWICGAPLVEETPARSADDFSPAAVDARAPWAAKLEIIEERFADGGMTVSNCSGAVVAPRWVLTAAHCVGQEGWESVRATLGARDAADAKAVRRAGVVALCHQSFDPRNLAFDVALLRLDAPLPPKFPILRIATETEAGRLTRGDRALSAGWGRISSSEISQTLRAATVRVVNPERQGDGMIVAAPEKNEQSLCVGESGAPLVADLGAGQALFGVFSSVDAYLNPRTGRMVELCEGFEARSYFTAVRGLQSWIFRTIDFCERHPRQCDPA